MKALLLPLYLLGGIGAGTLYFSGLWWSAEQFGQTQRLRTLFALMATRFIVLGGILAAASLAGAMPLLVTAGGVLLARMAVLRLVPAA